MIPTFEHILRRLGREREEAERLAHVVRMGIRTLFQTQIPRMAAALAYRTIFSLVPVFVIGLVVVGEFADDEQLEYQLERLMEYIGLSDIALPQDASVLPEAAVADPDASLIDPGPADAPDVPDAPALGPPVAAPAPVASTEPTGIPLMGRNGGGAAASIDTDPASPDTVAEAQTKLDDWLQSVVAQVRGIQFQAIGIVGVLVLVYAALSMLVELERAFNQIYHAPSGRAWTRRVAIYWTTLTLGTVFLLGTFYLGDQFATWAAGSAKEGEETGFGALVGRGVIEAIVNIMINVVLLLLAYTAVPNTRVQLRSAAAGALIAGAVWELGKYGFTLYVTYATGNLEKLYGAIALLPLFMLWIYITWVVVLFGLQVAYALQSFATWSIEVDEQSSVTRRVDPACGLMAALTVTRRFFEGQPTTPNVIARDADLDERTALALLVRFEAEGLVRSVTYKDDEDRSFVLARPPETVKARELMQTMRRVSAGIAAGSIGRPGDTGSVESAERAVRGRPTRAGHWAGIFAELERAELERLGERTLTDLVREQNAALVDSPAAAGALTPGRAPEPTAHDRPATNGPVNPAGRTVAGSASNVP